MSGVQGMAPRWYGDEGDTISQFPQFTTVGTPGQIAAGIYNPDRRYGFMAPTTNSFFTVTENDGTYNFVNEWRATVYDAAGHAWFAENGNLIWRENVAFTQLQTGVSVQSIPAISGCIVTDMEVYQINGVRNIFYTYQNPGATKGDMGNIISPDSGGTVNFLSTTPVGAFNLGQDNDHFMVVADNGYMYIGDGNFIHKFDGTTLTGGANGTATANVLVTPPAYTFTDGVDFKGTTWFTVVDTPVVNASSVAFSGNNCGVFVWDRQTTIVNMEDFIPVRGVRNIKKIWVTQDGKVRILCMSAKRTTQIREYNGVVFETVAEAHLVSYPTYRDSVQIAGTMVYWLGGDARTYAYGALVNGTPEQLYVPGDMTSVPQTNFTAGAMLFVDANSSTSVSRTGFSFSIKDATPTVFNKIWHPNLTATFSAPGNVYSLVQYFPYPVKINYARIYHNTGSTAGATVQGTLNVYLNQATTATKAFSVTRDDIVKGWKYLPINQGAKNAVFSIQVSVTWPTNVVTSDTTDWMPRMLEVDYNPLPKLQ